MKTPTLRISLVQTDIVWENKLENIKCLHKYIKLRHSQTDIFVLPETFSTGFSSNSQLLAETMDGETISKLKLWAEEYDVAICGSFIARVDDKFYNRAFFITPNEEHYYDKRHLFRMSDEPKYYSAGNERLVFEHKGFNICLLICYDLRFPVWARNVNNEYDLLIYVANWPASRSDVWNTLLKARAIENMSYVCGVNRVGEDGNGTKHDGDSKILNAKGEELSSICKGEDIETITIRKDELDIFRNKFAVWKDADKFKLSTN